MGRHRVLQADARDPPSYEGLMTVRRTAPAIVIDSKSPQLHQAVRANRRDSLTPQDSTAFQYLAAP